jgi:hypothetical protein
MALRLSSLDASLAALDQQLARLPVAGAVSVAVARWRADASALRFHLGDPGERPPLLAILGGTGTGKSTILNRLTGADLSAASFRRTFTAGPVAVSWSRHYLPSGYLGVPHAVASAEQLPARGEPDRLIIVLKESDLTRRLTVIDTPDLDGDQPAHHAQADRVFRWAEALLLVVTPEKYQMPELLPYYRLAQRYAVPTLFVMNKAEQQPAVEDYRNQLIASRGASPDRPRVYAVPRDDAGFDPPFEMSLGALRDAMMSVARPEAAARNEGLRHRIADLLDRFHDQILQPMRADRAAADATTQMLRSMEAPQAGVDVNPLTRSLARRLQQRSILYLMGPARVMDRVRQVPALLARLPRTTWDLVMHGKADLSLQSGAGNEKNVPDFQAILIEQFAVLQSRIDDAIRSVGAGEKWASADPQGYQAARLPRERAGAIATDELAQLRAWLENRWNATPRDTAVLQRFLKRLPGGERLTRWSEAAPYLLTVIVATHHVMFGHVDLMILGGYSLAMWLTERMSNEVAGRTRLTNRRIAERFETLAHEQIEQACRWLESRAPTAKEIEKLTKSAEALNP